jgi:hypothetical protein
MQSKSNRLYGDPVARPMSSFTGERAQYAVDIALRYLREREQTERVRALAARAEDLRTEIERWRTEPPTVEMLERATTSALSIHVEAVALARKAPAA